MRSLRWTALLAALAALPLVGCQKQAEETPPAAQAPAPEPFRVTAIALGRSLGADLKVTTPDSAFAPRDTFYVSIASEGTAASTALRAKWMFEPGTRHEEVVADDMQTIAPTGPAYSEFHLSHPGGWPKGDYMVEVFVDTTSVGTRKLTVR